MIAFPSILAGIARQAGIKTPPDPDDFDKKTYPHFFLFVVVQLGTPMPSPDAAHVNAGIIAEVPESETQTVTFEQLEKRGLLIGPALV